TILTRAKTDTNALLSQRAGWILFSLFIVVGLVMVLQTRAEYRKRTYDPTWAIKFSEIFDSERMRTARAKAACALKDKDTLSSEVDEVLNFFEDLGFYMQGDQLTPEVAHHAFQYWIRGYYSAAYEYLKAGQEQEQSHWEFIGMLLEATNEIERERVKDGR